MKAFKVIVTILLGAGLVVLAVVMGWLKLPVRQAGPVALNTGPKPSTVRTTTPTTAATTYPPYNGRTSGNDPAGYGHTWHTRWVGGRQLQLPGPA